MSSFKLVPANNSKSAAINLSMTVPSGWKADNASPSEIEIEVPGLAMGSRVAVSASELKGTPAEMMEKAIGAQGFAAGDRTELSGGRVWAQKTTRMTDARVFVPYAGGVVIATALLRDTAKLAEIRKAFETLAVTP